MDFGKCLMIGFKGLKPDKDFLSFISDENIGSVILFSENYQSKNQLVDLIGELKYRNNDLLIAVDQEGGRVVRFKNEFSQIPAFREIAKSGDSSLAFKLGKEVALELHSVGVDWNLSPVLDVNTNPLNPVIGDRSFGEDPKIVAEYAVLMMKGLHAGKVLSCGKHFPGHGDASVDSHLDLPIIENPAERWQKIDLFPFQVAIENDIPAIMTAHLLAKSIDSLPASISKVIITNILRSELGFKGVVISDDLNMKGISKLMTVEDAAVNALRAGSDMLIIRSDLKLQISVLKELKRIRDVDCEAIDERLDGLRRLHKSL